MAARFLMVVAVLMALYGCAHSPETKDSFKGVEPLDPEASALGTVVLTGQNVELESGVVEQADRDGRLQAYVYLECGYAGPCSSSASPSASASATALASRSDPRYEDILDGYEDILDAFSKPATFKLVVAVPVIGPAAGAVVLILIELIE